jgi:hypothetical protein
VVSEKWKAGMSDWSTVREQERQVRCRPMRKL